MSPHSIAYRRMAQSGRAPAAALLFAALVALSPISQGTAVGLISLVAVNDSYSVRHDRTLTIAAPGVLANDVGIGGGSTAVLNAGPTHAAQFSLQANGSFTYRPVAGFVGTDTFRYHAHDVLLDSSVATVTLTVTNTAPAAKDDAYVATTGVSMTVPAPGVLANDTDADGDPLVAQLVDGGGNGSLDLNADGSFTFTSGGSFTGDRTFTYRVSDGLVWSAAATVTIAVSPKATPTPSPTPIPTPTPSPTAAPLPTAVPIPTSIPIPSLVPIPTVQLPIPTPTTAPPAPTGQPAPSAAAPGGTVVTPPGSGGSTAGGSSAGGSSAGGPGSKVPGDGGLELDDPAPFGDLDGLGFAGFGGFDWAVPSLVLSVPGLLLILALLAQGGVGLFSLPFVRRKLGNFGLRPRRIGEARIR